MLCRKLGGLATHQRVVHPVQGTTSRPEFRITVATAPAANELVQPRNVRGAGAVMHAKVYRDPPPELLTVCMGSRELQANGNHLGRGEGDAGAVKRAVEKLAEPVVAF